jgi:hypothetical protein
MPAMMRAKIKAPHNCSQLKARATPGLIVIELDAEAKE